MTTCTLDLYTDYLLSSTGPTPATGLEAHLNEPTSAAAGQISGRPRSIGWEEQVDK